MAATMAGLGGQISLDDLSVEERLDDLPRPGAPPRLTANQICQIQQLACEKPEKSGVQLANGQVVEIAAEIIEAGHCRYNFSASFCQNS